MSEENKTELTPTMKLRWRFLGHVDGIPIKGITGNYALQQMFIDKDGNEIWLDITTGD